MVDLLGELLQGLLVGLGPRGWFGHSFRQLKVPFQNVLGNFTNILQSIKEKPSRLTNDMMDI
jgi:hypothetical protein